MKKLAAISLLVIATLPFLIKTGLVLHYYFNYTYYAEVLCENKDKPEMHCNGTCALGRELQAAEHAKQQAETNIPALSKIEISTFIPADKSPEYSFGFIQNLCQVTVSNETLTECLFGSDIFHPPIV